jgi:predicted nucleic-acid-binding Zn-ribbon protein
MNTQEQQATPCPECGSQRYNSKRKRIEIDATGITIHGSVVFCVTCGHTTFYVSNPTNEIAKLEEDRKKQEYSIQRQAQEAAFQLAEEERRRVEKKQRQAQKKKGFFGF